MLPGSAEVDEIVVVVPAADEQDRIGACLESLLAARRQVHQLHPALVVRVVVVLDSCTDRTEDVVGRYSEVQSLSISARCVGAARRIGVDHALASAHAPIARTWIASTDADSRVPADWLMGICRAAETGHHAVFGTVVPGSGLAAEVAAQWFARHQIGDEHNHVHGTNMSVRADVYAAVGGWPCLESGEDVELARRLTAWPGVSVLRSGAAPVVTSARHIARAPDGFARYLRDLAEDCAQQSLHTSAEPGSGIHSDQRSGHDALILSDGPSGPGPHL